MSPSVRRLVRHYKLDITGIHGSGPAGRIRVSDVMPLLGGRESVGVRDEAEEDAAREIQAAVVPAERASASEEAVPDVARAARLATVVFECDMSRVLGKRKRAEERGARLSLESDVTHACARALAAVPAVNAASNRMDIAVTIDAEPSPQTALVTNAGALNLDDIERATQAPTETSGATPTFSVRHHGSSGSLLALPLEPAAGTHAILGVGKLRKMVTVATVDGDETPRIAAMCYLTLSFDAATVDERSAHAFLRTLVATLES